MLYHNVCLQGFGVALPPRTVSSAELEAELAPLYSRLKLPAGRLELMTGIHTRRLWPEGTKPSSAAAAAGSEQTGCGAGDQEAPAAQAGVVCAHGRLTPSGSC